MQDGIIAQLPVSYNIAELPGLGQGAVTKTATKYCFDHCCQLLNELLNSKDSVLRYGRITRH